MNTVFKDGWPPDPTPAGYKPPAVCPSCKGMTTVYAFVTFVDGRCAPDLVRCSTCDGTGTLDEGYAKRLDGGSRLRAARHAREMTQGEAARKCGVSVVTWSAAEHARKGCRDADELLGLLGPAPAGDGGEGR